MLEPQKEVFKKLKTNLKKLQKLNSTMLRRK